MTQDTNTASGVAILLKALTEATRSLETIQLLAGKDDTLEDMMQVRAYATSRAMVANVAIAAFEDAALASAPASSQEYAELPKNRCVINTYMLSEDDARAFADATCALRTASHGQAPAGAMDVDAYSAACYLANTLFEKHFRREPDYASGRLVWGLCETTVGVISQIDNMVSWLMQPDAGVLEDAARSEVDAAFEAVRLVLCKLPRYSFYIDTGGGVRKVGDKIGKWIEFDAAHKLFDPVAVDAAIAQQKGQSHE